MTKDMLKEISFEEAVGFILDMNNIDYDSDDLERVTRLAFDKLASISATSSLMGLIEEKEK